jgi:molybdate transport system permease protein
MNAEFLETMFVTFKLAVITTFFLFFIGIALGYYLAFTKSRFKPFFETLIAMPLVLPPSVLGFYLLIAFSPENFLGAFLRDNFSIHLIFSFEGLVIASVLFSLPFMVQPMQTGFSSLSQNMIFASYTLGKSKFETLIKVMIPNIKSSILSAVVITFAHTIGEFGVVLMIGGNIAGETKVASIAIYDEVESLNYAVANQYALTLFIISFTVLLSVYYLNKK